MPFEWNTLLVPDSHAVAIYLTAFIVWVVYKLEQRDRRINAARILIEEIRDAETAIDNAKAIGGVTSAMSIMPNASWATLKYLFVKKLDQDEIKFISNYYSDCQLAEKYLTDLKNVLPKAIEEKSGYIQRALVELATKHPFGSADYIAAQKQLTEGVSKEEWYFAPDQPKNMIFSVISRIPKFIGTTTFEKLRKLAKI